MTDKMLNKLQRYYSIHESRFCTLILFTHCFIPSQPLVLGNAVTKKICDNESLCIISSYIKHQVIHTTIHEMGHIFGLDHVAFSGDKSDIMLAGANKRENEFVKFSEKSKIEICEFVRDRIGKDVNHELKCYHFYNYAHQLRSGAFASRTEAIIILFV